MFTLNDLQTTHISEGLSGNSFNATHLAYTYGVGRPHDLDAVAANDRNMAKLFSATDMFKNKPLLGILNVKQTPLELSSDRFTWKMLGSDYREVQVVNYINPVSRPGHRNTTFDVVLESDQYDLADVLLSEDENYPMEIVSKEPYGTDGTKYTLILQTSNENDFIPPYLLEKGRLFVCMSTSVTDEMNKRFGSIEFETIYQLEGTVSQAAMALQMTDKALRMDSQGNAKEQVSMWRVPYKLQDGRTFYNFMPMAETKMWETMYRGIEKALMFGKRSQREVDGYMKQTGSGLRELLKSSSYLPHTFDLTIEELEEFMSDLLIHRTNADAADRKVTAMTGEYGRRFFSQMIGDAAALYNLIDTHFVHGKDPRYLGFGAQFEYYVGNNGLGIYTMLNPMYDDPSISRRRHPQNPKRSLNSWRMDFLDFGKVRGYEQFGDNIQMVRQRQADYYLVHNGKWDKRTGSPINDGGAGNTMIGGYRIEVEKSFGLLMRDRSRAAVVDVAYNI